MEGHNILHFIFREVCCSPLILDCLIGYGSEVEWYPFNILMKIVALDYIPWLLQQPINLIDVFLTEWHFQ